MYQQSLSPDIAFLLHTGFSVEKLVRLTLEAGRTGVYPHQTLLMNGMMTEGAYYRALAEATGLRFIAGAQDEVKFLHGLPLKEAGLACRAGIAQVVDVKGSYHLTAPYGRDVLQIVARLQAVPALARNLAITTPGFFRDVLMHTAPGGVMQHAVGMLQRQRPKDSARRSFKTFLFVFSVVVAMLLLAVLYRAETYAPLVGTLCAILYLSACYYRILAFNDYIVTKRAKPLPGHIADFDLPHCSIIVPLYREARLVRQLTEALSRIDYPRAKLDVIVLIEADDKPTAAALHDLKLSPEYRVLTLPHGQPRTKPRALQVGLSFARGDIVTIFDAEDVPHPQQLRAAAARFKSEDARLACLQAELRIDNAARSWLSNQFALEYAALFTVFLPSLAKRDLPILLGGTSNYFRTNVLRQIGGWDPWNVTEDADLGIRLARSGYRIGTLNLPTEEEAPVTLRNWLRQRLRWQKGWMQTFVVHFSQPRTLWRELGPAKLWALTATLGVSLLSAFAYPVILMFFVADIFVRFEVLQHNVVGASVFGISLAAFVGGNMFPLLHIHAGAKNTEHRFSLFSFATVWIYWLLVSIAAYGAMFSLLRAPHYWSKTDHLGRNSPRLKRKQHIEKDREKPIQRVRFISQLRLLPTRRLLASQARFKRNARI